MSTTDTALLAIHLASTAMMTGLIWFVQVVHYPLFSDVGPDDFVAYETEHQRRTAWVVGPLMGIEGVAALAVAATQRGEIGLVLPLTGLALLALIHASTVLIQVPAHTQLARSADAATKRRLVRTNWIRTIGWSLRTVVAVAMLIVSA